MGCPCRAARGWGEHVGSWEKGNLPILPWSFVLQGFTSPTTCWMASLLTFSLTYCWGVCVVCGGIDNSCGRRSQETKNKLEGWCYSKVIFVATFHLKICYERIWKIQTKQNKTKPEEDSSPQIKYNLTIQRSSVNILSTSFLYVMRICIILYISKILSFHFHLTVYYETFPLSLIVSENIVS